MLKMKTWRGKFIRTVGWVLLKVGMLDSDSLFNALLTVRALEEGLRVVEV